MAEKNNNDMKMERLLSKESAGYLTDGDSEDWSDYDAYYNTDDGDDEASCSFHPLLEEDMERLKLIYGAEAISYRLFAVVDSIDIELFFQTSFLEREVAVAWKIKPDEHLVVRLHLSVSHYLDGEVPKVEVFQPSQKEKFGIGSQMRKVLENFFFEEWKTLTNESVKNQLKEKLFTAQKKKSPAETSTGYFNGIRMDPMSMSKIIEMGFSPEMANNALILSRGNLDEAINLLLANPDGATLMDSPTKASTSSQSKPVAPPRRQRSRDAHHPPQPPGSSSDGAGGVLNDLSGFFTKFLSKPEKSPQESKRQPGLDQGFLVMVMRYVYQRLPTLNEFCVICDELHVFENGGMLKPAVCARELCVFAYMSLGVMSDAADDIATGADVVDLLIAMANAAARSQKNEVIFDPYPSVVHPKKPKEFAFSPKKKDFARVWKAIDSFMRMSEMMTLTGADLKRELDKRDILAYPLLQWVITSNRSHIMKLPREKQIGGMRTPHQFLLMSSPPKKEAIFREARVKHGSTFAFHGSPLENWHSIMRQGLINASGTKYQRHGAAYGKGIYLSPTISVSFGYSGMGNPHSAFMYSKQGRQVNPASTLVTKNGPKRQRRFLQSTNLTCIALCEVITSKDLKKNGNIWVMPEPDHVCTKFFFVYEDGEMGDANMNTSDPKFCQEIQKALGYQAS